MICTACLTAAVLAATPEPPDLRPYRKFAERVERAIRENDAKAFPRLVDMTALLDRAFLGLDAPPGFREGFASTAGDGSPVLAAGAQIVADGGSVRLLRVRAVGWEVRALYRFLTASGGFNYTDIILSDPRHRRPRVIDAYVSTSGETMSETVGRVVAVGILEFRASQVGVGNVDGFMAGIKQVQRIIKLNQEKKFREALAEWDKLSTQFRRNKTFAMLRFAAACGLMAEDEAVYRTVLEEHLKQFPNDSGADMLGLDTLWFAKNYKACRAAVDRIDRAVGGDPYMDVFRANISLAEGNPADAVRAADRALAAEPGLTQAVWSLVEVSLATKDYAETARLLTRLEAKYGVVMGDLTKVEVYKGFVTSDAYRKWQAQREKAPSGPKEPAPLTPPAPPAPTFPPPARSAD